MRERLVFKDVTVDIPIYDVKSRSLKHRIFLDKVSTLISRSETSVGGSVMQNQRGVVTVRALERINFTAADGDRIAVIGHNGAGKTTLLRVAAGIFEPSEGNVAIRGRIMPLFNMLEGMAADATGVEMIHTRGTLLGMSESEIAERVEDISEFCELGEYIDMPVRTYSSGMLMRLAFGITTAIVSDVLIMDEIISTGDATFFERAEKRLREFVDQSSVLLIATHSPDVARTWCNRAMLLQHGRMVEYGEVNSILEAYARSTAN
jgi:ABC-type polysaccharide/polyol phosphate transport system ATPase subunit